MGMTTQEINRERTVADIPDAELLERAVKSVTSRCKREFAWVAIRETFGLGSTFSVQLCERFGIDPETGQRAKK